MMRKLVAALLVLAISAPIAAANVQEQPNTSPGAWWDEQSAGWLGGAVGGSVGILGAVFGVMAGLGLARRFVLVGALVLTCVGFLALLFGIAAVIAGQPYHVYYLPLLVGGIMAMVFGINYPIIKRRNEQMELQQMSALDS